MSDLGNVPAFPTPSDPNRNYGLSKREIFAAFAMQGWIAHPGDSGPLDNPFGMCAEYSVKYADALLLELEKK